MKMNMIIRKKHLILATLVVALALAVYLNWQFAQNDGNYIISSLLDSSNKNYGDAQLVNNNNVETSEILTQARIEKEKARGDAAAALETMLQNTEISDEELQTLVQQGASLAAAIEAESKIETIVKSKGMDCVVYLTNEKANVTVHSKEGLSNQQAIQIQEAILSNFPIKSENIIIVEVK